MSITTSLTGSERAADAVWKPIWSQTVSFGASGLAIIPVFRHYVLKSDLQMGLPSPTLLPFEKGIQLGIKAAPSTSLAVGVPLLMQRHIEPLVQEEKEKTTWRSLMLSAAIVGALSTPILLVFEGHSLKEGALASLKHITCPRQYLFFSIQEAGCVAGLSAAKHVDSEVRKCFNIQENSFLTYGSAFLSGSAGAIAGHAGNTVSTRLRSGLPIDYRSVSQLSLGLLPRARALGCFSASYHLICNTFDSRDYKKHKYEKVPNCHEL